ncbi:glycoside hydrolase family 36 protein [Pseudonocardia sp. CA-107938]|uniref:glycoside hydrolase family 36 protein n=1 Tax=Pseudonocardia sp. CA-107938 TaxID=3240021 RepID=UPI003D8CD22B
MSELLAPVDPTAGTDRITWRFGAGAVRLLAGADAPVRLVSVQPGDDAAEWPTDLVHTVPLVELGLGTEGRKGASPHAQHRRYLPSSRLRHVSHEATSSGGVDVLTVEQQDPETGVVVTTRLEHRPGASAFRATTHLRNGGGAAVAVRYVSSFTLAGFADQDIIDAPKRLQLHHARNAWDAEFRWHRTTLEDAGVVDIGRIGEGNDSSLGHFAVRGYGSWSSGDHLPAGAITDRVTGRAWTWQLEHNGPWQWEALDRQGRLYVGMSGPTAEDHEWEVVLEPGAEFTSVPVAVAVSTDGLDGALAEITRYRRQIRRPHGDNAACPVIFNDYMNCLMGDPTTERLLPLVEAAAAAGAEYFVIDAGWYSDEPGWWDSVGEWLPAKSRFPNGLAEVTDAITAAGMIPGLWLEPEVVGVRSPLLDRLPTEALFCRDGVPIVENGRHQLDFRHPAVVRHLDETVDRLVAEFGVGYFKLDYNINIGAGTDVDGARPGAGLLGHNRAYSAWIDSVLDRHPDLVLENCSSGGMRVDYAQLARHSIQSTSDQTDPERYVSIAAAAPASVTPEQSAVWAYPQPDWTTDVNDLTLVNALLGRVHLSGRIDLLDEAGRAAVRAAMDTYKALRHRIPHALPVWPLGLPGWYDAWCAAGLVDDEGMLLQVWRRGGSGSSADTAALPIPAFAGRDVDVEVLYPVGGNGSATWSRADGALQVQLPDAPSARLLRLVPRA